MGGVTGLESAIINCNCEKKDIENSPILIKGKIILAKDQQTMHLRWIWEEKKGIVEYKKSTENKIMHDHSCTKRNIMKLLIERRKASTSRGKLCESRSKQIIGVGQLTGECWGLLIR